MLTPGWRFPGSSKGFVKELLASPRMPLFTSTIVPCASEVPGSGGCYLGGLSCFSSLGRVYPDAAGVFASMYLWEGALWGAPGWVEDEFVPLG